MQAWANRFLPSRSGLDDVLPGHPRVNRGDADENRRSTCGNPTCYQLRIDYFGTPRMRVARGRRIASVVSGLARLFAPYLLSPDQRDPSRERVVHHRSALVAPPRNLLAPATRRRGPGLPAASRGRAVPPGHRLRHARRRIGAHAGRDRSSLRPARRACSRRGGGGANALWLGPLSGAARIRARRKCITFTSSWPTGPQRRLGCPASMSVRRSAARRGCSGG